MQVCGEHHAWNVTISDCKREYRYHRRRRYCDSSALGVSVAVKSCDHHTFSSSVATYQCHLLLLHDDDDDDLLLHDDDLLLHDDDDDLLHDDSR